MPSVVIEVLRFCVIVVCAGAGLEFARSLSTSYELKVGALDGSGLGVLLGSAIGYVLGGMIGRLTGRSLLEAEEVLASRSAEQVLAGMLGAVLGLFLAVGLSWPILLLGTLIVTLPIFVFICVTVGTLGYRVGLHRRRGLIALVGPSAGFGPSRRQPSALAQLVDTSVLIDGRIVDVVRAGFLHGGFFVTQPVLAELQGLADAGDDLRRGKGRHGLEVLESLRREPGVDLEVIRDEALEVPEVDAKLVRIALDRGAALLTLDAVDEPARASDVPQQVAGALAYQAAGLGPARSSALRVHAVEQAEWESEREGAPAGHTPGALAVMLFHEFLGAYWKQYIDGQRAHFDEFVLWALGGVAN